MRSRFQMDMPEMGVDSMDGNSQEIRDCFPALALSHQLDNLLLAGTELRRVLRSHLTHRWTVSFYVNVHQFCFPRKGTDALFDLLCPDTTVRGTVKISMI